MLFLIIIGVIIICMLMIALLFINIIIPRMMMHSLETYENELIKRQFEEINNVYNEMRGFRHDLRNHMQVLKTHIDNGNLDECARYLLEMNEDLSSIDHVIKTGNIMADAIINSKVSLAKSKEISTDVTVQLPGTLPVSDVEFCVLFGNLMDNAIEACEKIDEDGMRFIRIYVGMFKKQFYISVTNSTNEKARTGSYHSRKEGEHGFGLYRIDKIIRLKNGWLNRKDEPGVFATEIMLPFVS